MPSPLPGAPPGSVYRQLMARRHAALAADPHVRTPYYLAECIVVKRAGPSLREHIVRNSLAGVDAFFVQRRSFYDCVRRHGRAARWMTLLDSDEFFETAAPPTAWAPHPAAFAHTPFLWASLRPLEARTPLVPVRWSTALTSGRLVPPPPGSPHTLASYHPTTCATGVGANPRELADWKSIFQPAALDMRAGSPNHDAFFVHGATDARSPANRSVIARTDVRAAFRPPWAGLARLNETAMAPPHGPAHRVAAAETAADARVPAAVARTDGVKGGELARRLLAGQTVDADAMCAAGAGAMCIRAGERGRYPWAWARWMADPTLTVEEAVWMRI
ncbi:hypothetical protein I4F81_002771 [Pyropia yezoensis]|uniref:Uncharacterized protein n=1 Tax=Pyropia yezoensis TaxID=2788 RepID=A0ACC3BQP6_PYRYE|nr:hypothetical protein I4F81_002771 [Neopyropia yezoensis]